METMDRHTNSILLLGTLLMLVGGVHSQSASAWISTGDSLIKLEEVDPIPGSDDSVGGYTINVDRTQSDQSIKGFGAALSNAAAWLLYNETSNREETLRSLFDATDGIGLSYIRLVMGGSDFNAVEPYTYDDMPPGQKDFELENFSIEKDTYFIIPLLKEILAINNDVRIMASPWTAPAWMKTNDNMFGGELLSGEEYLNVLADYFVRFLQAYAAEGIQIDTVTLQNEPEHRDPGYPTMGMSWQTQQQLIRDYVGPKFSEAGITTEVIIFDHNWDMAWYPLNILADAEARQYITGSAWHCYNGDRYDPTEVRDAYPDQDLYFTECSGGEWDTHFGSSLGWNVQNLLIGQTRIGSRAVLLWNMALDNLHGPRVGVTGGCSDCRGVITVDPAGRFERNVEYYSLGHFSKFVRPSALKIFSSTFESEELETVAYENQDDGSVVVVVLNAAWGEVTKTFQVLIDGSYYYYEDLPSRSVLTIIKS